MARDPRRIPFSGPAFIRLLAALDDAPAAATRGAFAERLSRWFDWTDAISLSGALGGATTTLTEPPSAAHPMMNVEERELARVRAALARRITDATSTPVETAKPLRKLAAPVPLPPLPDDFPSWRQRYVACQQAMETAIAPLRRRVRSTMAGASPAMARLADVDAVVEQVVGEQEYVLLAGVPSRLERRFDRLRDAAMPGDVDVPPVPVAWLDGFRLEMRDLLLAELELRLQPVEGLLDALRKSSPDTISST